MRKELYEFKGEKDLTLSAVMWLPDEEPKIIVQIVHGMTEHMGRYEKVAKELTSVGIGVAGFDLRGHGKTGQGMACASFGQDGWKLTLEEIHSFHNDLKKRFANSKHFLLGFSLGAFLVREYFGTYDEHDIKGAIIMGTGMQSNWILSIIMMIVKCEIRKIGFDNTNDFIKNLSFGTYNKNFMPNRTYVDWLCSDEEQVDLYIRDDLCKECISAGLFYQLLESMKITACDKSYERWNKNMPLLLISGSKDPVGDKGKGVKLVEKSMKKNGLTNVICKLYEGGRHDILHEEKNGIASDLTEIIKKWLLESSK